MLRSILQGHLGENQLSFMNVMGSDPDMQNGFDLAFGTPHRDTQCPC